MAAQPMHREFADMTEWLIPNTGYFQPAYGLLLSGSLFSLLAKGVLVMSWYHYSSVPWEKGVETVARWPDAGWRLTLLLWAITAPAK